MIYLLFASFQILLYDIRSNKPLLLKDHMYGLPIRDLMFHESQDLVLSCDTRILKLWERETVSNALFTLAYLSIGRVYDRTTQTNIEMGNIYYQYTILAKWDSSV